MDALAADFRQLTERGLLRADDPHTAADHFAGLALWTPVNQALLVADTPPPEPAGHQSPCHRGHPRLPRRIPLSPPPAEPRH
ncbi:TetR/AcrR family transcriptional regulator C-terminal domain-containing protein [Streptomyces halobius]|uniref:TetR/AcrR family transcriptional regulator C-terminal domain-containing protein n=1 Tax=Streptomyces halobius TaxID=2879846 RepID=UPI00200F5928|nr:TetR/AcrR family transcriptional regulator C-terminal domain-containing protein [Streptomyces halobius]